MESEQFIINRSHEPKAIRIPLPEPPFRVTSDEVAINCLDEICAL